MPKTLEEVYRDGLRTWLSLQPLINSREAELQNGGHNLESRATDEAKNESNDTPTQGRTMKIKTNEQALAEAMRIKLDLNILTLALEGIPIPSLEDLVARNNEGLEEEEDLSVEVEPRIAIPDARD